MAKADFNEMAGLIDANRGSSLTSDMDELLKAVKKIDFTRILDRLSKIGNDFHKALGNHFKEFLATYAAINLKNVLKNPFTEYQKRMGDHFKNYFNNYFKNVEGSISKIRKKTEKIWDFKDEKEVAESQIKSERKSKRKDVRERLFRFLDRHPQQQEIATKFLKYKDQEADFDAAVKKTEWQERLKKQSEDAINFLNKDSAEVNELNKGFNKKKNSFAYKGVQGYKWIKNLFNFGQKAGAAEEGAGGLGGIGKILGGAGGAAEGGGLAEGIGALGAAGEGGGLAGAGGGLAAAGGPVGIVIGGLLVLGEVLWKVAKKIVQIVGIIIAAAYGMLAFQRRLADSSPSIAAAFAGRDVAVRMHKFRLGEGTAASTEQLIESINRLEKAAEPLIIFLTNAINKLLSWLLDNFVTPLVTLLSAIADKLNEWFGWAKQNAEKANGPATLQDVARGIFGQYRGMTPSRQNLLPIGRAGLAARGQFAFAN